VKTCYVLAYEGTLSQIQLCYKLVTWLLVSITGTIHGKEMQ
jgi:hypothetical protein